MRQLYFSPSRFSIDRVWRGSIVSTTFERLFKSFPVNVYGNHPICFSTQCSIRVSPSHASYGTKSHEEVLLSSLWNPRSLPA